MWAKPKMLEVNLVGCCNQRNSEKHPFHFLFNTWRYNTLLLARRWDVKAHVTMPKWSERDNSDLQGHVTCVKWISKWQIFLRLPLSPYASVFRQGISFNPAWTVTEGHDGLYKWRCCNCSIGGCEPFGLMNIFIFIV